MVHESGLSVLKGKETDPAIFELEMWVLALSSFFDLDHLPMSAYERDHASLHNYRPETACVKSGLERILLAMRSLLGEDRVGFTQFVHYLDSVRKSDRASQDSIQGELVQSVEHVQNLIRVAGDLATVTYLSLQTYAAYGNVLRALLERKGVMMKLFKGRAMPRLSEVSKESLLPLLKRTKEHPNGAIHLSIIMLHFKILRFLKHVEDLLSGGRHYPAAVLIFSLIHATFQELENVLSKKVIASLKDESLVVFIESLLFSSRMELRKVMELELVDINLLLDPQVVHGKLEDSLGICRDLIQQNIISMLMLSTDKPIKGEDIFPYYQNRREQSVQLLDSLTDLQDKASLFVEEGSRPAYRKMMKSLESFHTTQMKYLMYKDWGTVDRFYYDLKNTESLKQRGFLAHQMEVFLLTLMGEVRKRAVLK